MNARERPAGRALRRRILETIALLSVRDGRPPTIRELGAALGGKSTGVLSHHLDVLVRQGRLRRAGFSARGYRPIAPPQPARRAGSNQATCVFVHDVSALGNLEPVGALGPVAALALAATCTAAAAGQPVTTEHVADLLGMPPPVLGAFVAIRPLTLPE